MPKNFILSVMVRAELLYEMCSGYIRNLEEVNFTMCFLFEYQLVVLKLFKTIT
jgi:hypothetical protein